MLISDAYAQASPAAAGGDMFTSFGMMAAIMVGFYFLLIRPQQKKQKELKAMIDAVQKGDEVLTAGGVLGKAVKVHDAYVTVEIADGVQILVQKHTIQAVLPKGTIKGIS